jgi:hypothetical protein
MSRWTLFLLTGATALALATTESAAARRVTIWTPPAAAEPRAANWTYSGCWSPRLGAPCVDVYRDASGNAWTCKACRTTKSPGPGKCSPVSEAQLAAGRWCS